MAEVIGLVSSFLTLAAFASKSARKLHNTVKSFRSRPEQVRELSKELEGLCSALQELTETKSSSVKDVDYLALQMPLERCGTTCEEFEQSILKWHSRLGYRRKSLRDWARLKCMGKGIDSFRQQFLEYRCAFSIVVTNINLHASSITSKCLKDYKALIQSATSDLQAHFQSVDGRLDSLLGSTIPKGDSEVIESNYAQGEWRSTQRCLRICAQLSQHIRQLELARIPGSQSAPYLRDAKSEAEKVFHKSLQKSMDSLESAATALREHMRDLLDRLATNSKMPVSSDEIEDLTDLWKEWETVRQCLDICSKANDNLEEKIFIVKNHATGNDEFQLLASIDGETTCGKGVGFSWRARQLEGRASDRTFQQATAALARRTNSFLRGVAELEEATKSCGSHTQAVQENGNDGMEEKRDRGLHDVEALTNRCCKRTSTPNNQVETEQQEQQDYGQDMLKSDSIMNRRQVGFARVKIDILSFTRPSPSAHLDQDSMTPSENETDFEGECCDNENNSEDVSEDVYFQKNQSPDGGGEFSSSSRDSTVNRSGADMNTDGSDNNGGQDPSPPRNPSRKTSKRTQFRFACPYQAFEASQT
ncbi:hypothetical protein FOWG_13087 [Fusarium oxysporum f. sp. lycopersici MN25]|nr:hypothetical protein FOWG_13087 [Fusarium oxysporum f. sp. lycopersici MN25]